ncbi:ABC transporter substrate-binding protein [Salininema proteolyticum]|uniref:ABC transporter substrate-binding protein n=1 Tax=Salininema proteolyticum TaxID=1607685 RepID=A0ABV8U3Z6_9ACTN
MRRTAVGLAAAATLMTSACVQSSSGKAEEDDTLIGTGTGANCTIDEVVKIGAVLSLDGGAAFAGSYQQQGLELAIDELNQKSGITYELILEDDKTDLQTSISATEKLLERDEVHAMIGPTLSNMAFSTYEDAQDAGVPTVGISTTAAGIPEIGEYIFRVSLPEEVALASSIPAAEASLEFETAAVMHDNEDEFTTSAFESMHQELQDLGTEIVANETFPTSETEFRAQLTKIDESGADVLVLSALPGATIPLVKQAREMGIDIPIVGGNAFNSPVMIGNLEDASENLVVGGAWSAEADTEGNIAFTESFQDAYDRPADQFAAQAYTAAYTIDEAIRASCNANRDSIRTELGRLSDFETVLGPITLSPDGEITQDPYIQIVKDGEFTLLNAE